jgi:hypothetical protein
MDLSLLYPWSLFLAVYLVSWDAAVQVCIQRLDDDILDLRGGVHGAAPVLFRRPYVIALLAFALANAALCVTCNMLLLYVACVVVTLTGRVVSNEFWRAKIVGWAAKPVVTMRALSSDHLHVHAAMLALVLVFGSLCVGFYITDADLADASVTRTKFLRILFVLPTVSVVVYLFYTAALVLLSS